MEVTELTPAEVVLEGLVDEDGRPLRLRALVEAGTWNGWAIPYFKEGETRRLVGALDCQAGCSASLDAERNVVVVLNEDADPQEETFSGAEVDGTLLYPVGASAWCWEIVSPEDSVQPGPPRTTETT